MIELHEVVLCTADRSSKTADFAVKGEFNADPFFAFVTLEGTEYKFNVREGLKQFKGPLGSFYFHYFKEEFSIAMRDHPLVLEVRERYLEKLVF